MGTKRHIVSDRRGAPLSAVISAANRTDMKLAAATLDGIVVPRPESTSACPQHLCRDKGFDAVAFTVPTDSLVRQAASLELPVLELPLAARAEE